MTMMFAVLLALAQSPPHVSVAELKTLRTLPKPTAMYTSNDSTFWTGDADYASEWCRIMGTVSIGLFDADDRIVRANAVAVARRLPLVLTYYGDADKATLCTRDITPGDKARMDRIKTQAAKFRALTTASVGRILIDYEPNGWRPAAQTSALVNATSYEKASHTLGLKRRIQYLHDLLKAEFPGAVQDWYKCGSVSFLHGWEPDTHGAELIAVPILDALLGAKPLCNNMTLYDGDLFWLMRFKYEQNVIAAKKRGAMLSVTIGLGFSYPEEWVHRSDGQWIVTGVGRDWPIPSKDMTRIAHMIYDKWWDPPDYPGNDIVEFVSWYPALCRASRPHVERNAVQVVRALNAYEAMPAKYRDDPAADLDHDGDVDMNDHGIFQRQVTGANTKETLIRKAAGE